MYALGAVFAEVKVDPDQVRSPALSAHSPQAASRKIHLR
jgi:hypothetical protein